MNAKEARSISEHECQIGTQQFLNNIFALIEKYAKQGKTMIFDINAQLPKEEPIKSLVIKQLNELGYQVKSEYDQKESTSWTTISW